MVNKITMSLDVNDVERDVAADGDATLLTVLRDEMGITSPKRGCNQGVCGSCTVMIDGEPRRGCVTQPGT